MPISIRLNNVHFTNINKFGKLEFIVSDDQKEKLLNIYDTLVVENHPFVSKKNNIIKITYKENKYSLMSMEDVEGFVGRIVNVEASVNPIYVKNIKDLSSKIKIAYIKLKYMELPIIE